VALIAQLGPLASSASVAWILATITQGFGNVEARDRFARGQIGKRPGDPQYAIVATRRQPQRFGSLGEKLAPRIIGRCGGLEQLAIGFGIGARRMAGVARRLDGAGRRYPCRDIGRGFRWWRQCEIGSTDRRDIDMEIDAIEERPRDSSLVIDRAFRRPRARPRGVPQIAAAAWVHRRHQLHPCWIADVRRRPCHHHRPGFEWLAQRIEDAALKFGQLVEEQDAEMGEADFAGPGTRAAPTSAGIEAL